MAYSTRYLLHLHGMRWVVMGLFLLFQPGCMCGCSSPSVERLPAVPPTVNNVDDASHGRQSAVRSVALSAPKYLHCEIERKEVVASN